MGSNSTQALGVIVFVLAFVMMAAGAALGGNLLLILLAVALLAASVGIFLNVKPWENRED
jgi:hypothetical protein